MRSLSIAAGFFISLILILVVGEFYSRIWIPSDLLVYLGESSPLTGPYRPDPVLGADYISFDSLQALYSKRLRELAPLQSTQPTWLWFGNSFVQANGMLGDTVAAALPKIRMFYLKRNEPLNLRVAQARMLLHAGLRPERIFFVILPIDLHGFARQPPSSIIVTSKGAITYDIGKPPFPISLLASHSQLVRIAWVRKELTRLPDVTAGLPPPLAQQLVAVLGLLTDSASAFDVPVTLILLPDREQIFGTQGFALQDQITKIAGAKNIDIFDARHLFDKRRNKMELFLPDWHFTSVANRDILEALLTHLSRNGFRSPDSAGASL